MQFCLKKAVLKIIINTEIGEETFKQLCDFSCCPFAPKELQLSSMTVLQEGHKVLDSELLGRTNMIRSWEGTVSLLNFR